jgi:Tfp pilus assembly protein PilO
MSAATDRLNAVLPRALPRVLPVVVGFVVVAFGYYWLLQSGISSYVRSLAEARTLETRVRALDDTVARGKGMTRPDEAEALRLFEERVSNEDQVADVLERLTRAVTESATDGKLRNLAIGTGDQSTTGAPGQPRPAAAGSTETIDPRWGLFPYNLTHTPVTLSFDASYATIVSFFSKIRDLPTAIEIRSVKLTRGLPLMTMQLTVFVFRRGDMIPGASLAAPAQPEENAPRPPRVEQPVFNPLAPRIVEPGGRGRGPGD